MGRFQLFQQLNNLFLHGNIQGAGGFVTYDDAGGEGKCPGDGGSLALTAAELVGVLSADFRGKAALF